MKRFAVSLLPMQQSAETNMPPAKESAGERALSPFAPHNAAEDEAEGTLDLRRAFRTPPPLMGGGWRGKRGQL